MKRLRLPALLCVLTGLSLLAGCGGRPKPSEEDLKSALNSAFADQPYQVVEVDFTRRDISGESAAITFEVEFRHAFDLYDRESLEEALQKIGKSGEALEASEAWSRLRSQPTYERIREKAGVPADAAPSTLPGHVLRRVVQAGETHRTKGQVRARWDGFKWIWSDDQIEQKPAKKGGRKRGEFADDLPVVGSDADLLALYEKAERDLAVMRKLVAAAEAIQTETLAAFAATLRPGLILGGEAIMKLEGGQRVPEDWTLEIQGVDPQQRRFTALLRGEAPWELARRVNGGWSFQLSDPCVRITLQSPRDAAVKNGGPFLSAARDQTLNAHVTEQGWKVEADSLRVIFNPLDADAVATRQKAARAEADALRALLAAQPVWHAILDGRDGADAHVWRLVRIDPVSGLVQATLETSGQPAHTRAFTGVIEPNRYLHDGWPLRLASAEGARVNIRDQAVRRTLGRALTVSYDVTVYLRAQDGRLEIKGQNSNHPWRIAGGDGVAGSAAPSASGFSGSGPETSGASAPSGSVVAPADWDGLTPILEIDGARTDAFAAAIKINQSPMDILRGSATIQLTETRPLPVLPAGGWRVLMGGEGVRKVGLDGPSLSRFDAKKLVRLEKTTAGFAAVPAAARLPMSVTPAGSGAWLAPRQPLAPGAYALLVDTTCFAFEVR